METEQLVKQLDPFFTAKSVAVIGASSTPGKIGYVIFQNMSQYGYKGKVYPINPKLTEIFGIKCYPSVLDVPGEVELVVFAVSSKLVPQILRDCGRKGVKAGVIVSGGFKELGEEYREIEDETVRVAKKHGIRLIGPNCVGIFDSKTHIDTLFQSYERMVRPKPGPIALMAQSATFGLAVAEQIAESGLGLSKFISYGNRCDVDEADLILYLGEDPLTKVIAIYIEGLGDGRKFIEAAKKVLPKKPIVVLKGGRTDWGAKTALSHTGWLAGSYPVYESAFKQAGILVAENVDELFDMAKVLILQNPASGNRVAMLTNGVGPCVMAADTFEERGIELARYEEETEEKLRRELPYFCVISNPVDLTGSATSQYYEVTMKALGEDPNVDIIMPFFVFQDTPLDEAITHIVPEMLRYGKPIVCCAAGGPYTKRQVSILEARGIPVYPTPERATAAVGALIQYGKLRAKGRPMELVASSKISTAKAKSSAKQIVKEVKAEGRRLLLEHESKAVLRSYDIPTTSERLFKSADEAIRSREIEFPVALKICSPTIVHKSDVGGVKLNIKNPDELRTSFEEIMSNVTSNFPKADIRGILVQNMVSPGREVIVGVSRDSTFGPVVMFGLGGIFVEVLHDVSFGLPPISKKDALEMIEEIKGYPILKGVRGEKPVDIEILTEILEKVSMMATDLEEIVEMDLNPIIVHEKGATVVDARIILT
ncbi:MAG: acetate--CoA ligase family protein [Candidatus Geothermarchaeales archaeon]